MEFYDEYRLKIAIEYPCHICGIVLSKPSTIISHIEKLHGYRLVARSVGRHRPAEPQYIRIQNPKTRADFDSFHCGCSSCWYHVPTEKNGLVALAIHVHDVHQPPNVDGTKNKNGDITLPQVKQIIRKKNLPSGNTVKGNDSMESEEEKQYTGLPGLYDICHQLEVLTNMFTALFKNNQHMDTQH